jgi:hypothetical protein
MAPDQAPNVWDVAGSSDLGRLAFNVFFIRRGPQTPGNDAVSNMLVHVLKQRTKGTTVEIPGFFYRLHRQFHVDSYATEPTKYLPDDQYPPAGINDDMPFHESNPDAFRVERAPIEEPRVEQPWEF